MELKSLNKEIAARLRACWENQLDNLDTDKPTTHYLQLLDWADRFANGSGDNEVYIYVLCKDDDVEAMLELSHVKRRDPHPYLKVLRIHVAPKWDQAESDEREIPVKELSQIAATALVGALGLTYGPHLSRSLKVWGTTPLTAEFLEGVVGRLDAGGVDDLRVFRQGNWMVIEKKQEEFVANSAM